MIHMEGKGGRIGRKAFFFFFCNSDLIFDVKLVLYCQVHRLLHLAVGDAGLKGAVQAGHPRSVSGS